MSYFFALSTDLRSTSFDGLAKAVYNGRWLYMNVCVCVFVTEYFFSSYSEGHIRNEIHWRARAHSYNCTVHTKKFITTSDSGSDV